MNSSQAIASQLQGVNFGCFTTEDVRALSARQITNSTTFDTLLNPVPGGLYSAELGQFGDNACATCGLKNPQCPGHAGHIELPVPCYHPTFMDQVLRLLRAACIYCGRLKMRRVAVARFIAKLQLVRYGLLKELNQLDEVQSKIGKGKDATPAGSDEDENDDGDADAKAVALRFERYVKDAIKNAKRNGTLSTEKTETTNNARKQIIREFMAAITVGKKCGNCNGINHNHRKDRYVKIFRKPLLEKEHIAMVQAGMKAKDPVVEMRRKMRLERSRKRKRDEDEAVADLSNTSEEEGDDVDIDDSSEGEPEIAGGVADESTTSKTQPEIYLNPSRVHAQLVQLFERDAEVLNLVYGGDSAGHSGVSADMFFLNALIVPPNKYRPEAKTGDNEIAEAQENSLYKAVLNACERLTEIQRELSGTEAPAVPRYRPSTYADFETTWLTLQESVNSLIDKNLSPLQGRAGARNADGVKQKLEKKEGMFRKYMMGKRVNFAARTVISPDPNIETNEIGVPPVFAVKLTYPEPVTQWNIEEMQEAVRNGAFIWPGALAIENENGSVLKLDRKNAEERTALANQLLAPAGTGNTRGTRPKKVHRHLNNGDIVIMNRQPTLHKPSMMCHRARVLPGEKTLRMHYANCNTYNADFDGDEMNMHFPQNELARAEALSIADTDHQYLSATAGNPLRGLIQDHISMCVWLTSRELFFERGDYMNLLYAALRPESGHCANDRLETMPPAIMKPKALWTGKQVISTVLKNLTPPGCLGLTVNGKSTTANTMWGPGGEEEGDVVVKDGELLQGIIDKKQIGPSSGGLVNAIYEAYGHAVAGKFLSVLGRLLTKLLHMRAFSCGVEDLIFTQKGEEDRRQALTGAQSIGLEVSAKYVGLADQKPTGEDRELQQRLEDVLRDDAKQHGLDQVTNNATGKISSGVSEKCMPAGLAKPFPKNQMQTMTTSGAKGTKVNVNLISCALGQQVLEGRRVPIMVSGKTLPCFKPFESNVRAGGYIVDRFLTGIRPQEYYFHAMAGREGLIDTAVKTSRSGYLQRCLIKGMEGLKVEYDTSVRNTEDGSIVQFLYGEDGLDIGKAKYLSDFKFAAENYISLYNNLEMNDNMASLISEEAKEHNKAAEKKYRKSGDLGASDPALAVYPPARHAGSISEKLLAKSRSWVDSNTERLIKDKKHGIDGPRTVSKKNFNAILEMRYLRSIVETGEAVGVVAGQSVGEPSTQMTLNTFHLAGHAAKNVTLGIPRLREIVMTAATNLATPTMTLRLNDDVDVEGAKKFAKGISKLSLGEIVDKVSVTESTGKGVAYAEAKRYEIKLDFFPAEEYSKEYAITISDVVNTIERRLLPRLQATTRKELKKRGDAKTLKSAKDDAMPDIGKSAGAIEQESNRPEANREGGDDDSDSEGDDDATRDKMKSNKQQAGYEAYEDEDEQVLKQRDATPEPEESPDEDEAYGGSPRSTPDAEDSSPRVSSAKDREIRIKSDSKTNDIIAFSFDDKKGATCSFTLEYDSATAKILMLHLLESALHASLIQSVPGIAMCMIDEEAMNEAKKDGLHSDAILAASGVNIPAMWELQHIIHPHHLYTNSIHDILVHYGVEAARNAIVKELAGVFGGHGISVDPRHLMLIADYMTRDGVYQAFSRMGYRGNPSPFMKMSFETTVNFLRDAVLEGEGDNFAGPSARIVAGRIGGVGTGGIDVFLPVDAVEKEGGEEEMVLAADEDGDVEMED
ncbi:dna-directed rna polymerase i subunit rpa1 like protein [Zymoseptoria brevis]|uniref:DNA-directed RNA polymerase subunit n=1 Tax=Zymoseptoria brevis TaxID=1047168 RepID=A0A0F4GNT9_9PEZI|nr:dna-directed rna polymerase i subunit rpa1 like protein [Zymoseptoria brevis]